MSKKTDFINYIESKIFDFSDANQNVVDYWLSLKEGATESEKSKFTDNGKLILKYMQDNPDITRFKAKDIAEGLFVSTRTVSGAIRKLVTDGYVEKMGLDPIIYSLTDMGKDTVVD